MARKNKCHLWHLILIILILSGLLLSGCSYQGFKESRYDWSTDIEEYMSLNHPDVKYDISSKRTRNGDEFYFLCTTKDDRELEFEINCRFEYQKDSSFGFFVNRTKVINNTLHEAGDNWLTENYGKIDITGLSVKEIIDIIEQRQEQAIRLYNDYNISSRTATGDVYMHLILYGEGILAEYNVYSMKREIVQKNVESILNGGKPIYSALY